MQFLNFSQRKNHPERQSPLLAKPKPKLVIFLLLVGTMLAVGVIALFSYNLVRQLILEQIREKAWLEVQQRKDEIDEWLATRKAELVTIANNPILRSGDWSVIRPYLQSELNRIQDFYSLIQVQPDGTLSDATLSVPQNENITFKVKDSATEICL